LYDFIQYAIKLHLNKYYETQYHRRMQEWTGDKETVINAGSNYLLAVN
jgi:hypothetical protein